MGRGNVCVRGDFEGLYYIDNENFEVYENCKEELFEFAKDLSYEQLVSDDWEFDEFETKMEWEGIEEHIVRRMQERFPSFKSCNERIGGLKNSCRAILENKMFYIALEDNQWSMAVELLEKEDPWDCSYRGLRAKHYQNYLDGLKEVLLEMFEEIGVYGGPWTSGTIRREEEVA